MAGTMRPQARGWCVSMAKAQGGASKMTTLRQSVLPASTRSRTQAALGHAPWFVSLRGRPVSAAFELKNAQQPIWRGCADASGQAVWRGLKRPCPLMMGTCRLHAGWRCSLRDGS